MKSRPLPSSLIPVNFFVLKILIVFFIFLGSATISYADIHTWVPAAGGAWTTATNWLPAGLPVAGDDIVINSDQTANITGVPTLGINSLLLNGTCTLVGTAGGATLIIGGASGTDFTISAGKTLIVGANLNITLAGNSASTIDGSLILSSGRTYNTNGAGVSTIVNGAIASFGSVTCSSAAKLLFQSGSTYNHALNGGIIPTATWADGSTCNVTGVVATQPDAASLGQNFYNLIWNNPNQTWNPTTGSIAAGADYKIRGTFTFVSSGTGSNPITLSGGIAVNYSLSLVNGSLTVTKATLRAIADNKVKIYGTDNPALTISYSGFVNGDNAASITEPSISTTCVTGSSAGTYPITLSGGTTANYLFTLVNGVMTVNKATATVTLANLSHIYNGTAKVATATTSPAGLTVNITYNGSSSAPVNAGTYNVSGTISNNNYQGSASGNMVIGKAPQIITFSDIPSGLRITEEHQLEASTSSGLSVSFVSSNSNIVSISGTVITVKGDGAISLIASQSGNSNWLPADDVVKTVVTLPTFDNVSSLFTPNNDGMNDYWYIPGLEEYGTLQVTVYNRFGQAVYKSDDYKNDWDGTWNGNPLPSASYYYIMKSTLKGLSKGVVNIIR